MSHRTIHSALVAAPLLASATAARSEDSAPTTEAEWIAKLQSSPELKDKIDACRELARLGGDSAVTPLAVLLADEKLSHMARYGLEENPSPAVDEALRVALGIVKGRLLIGVLASLGARQNPESVSAIAPFLNHDDPGVVNAAARALGRIGGEDAANALTSALDGASGAKQLSICQGLLVCAESMAAQRRGRRRDDTGRNPALAIYDRLRSISDAPHQIRAGALRGAIIARREQGVPLLLESLHSSDFVLVLAAARAAQELPSRSVSQALAMHLSRLDADRQVVVLRTLGHLRDAVAIPALLSSAKDGDSTVRVEALRALAEIGDKTIASDIQALKEDGDSAVAEAANACFEYLTS